MKKIKLLHMYHDILDLYGDRGNVSSLVYRSRARGIEIDVHTCTLGEKKRAADYDIVLIGGGADKEQSIIASDLLGRKRDFTDAIAGGTQFLLICGAYQLFGKYYVGASGERLEGLALGDYYTVSHSCLETETSGKNSRCIGNILIEAKIGGERMEILGFENHGGQTFGVEKPLGKVVSGFGNNFDSGYEGYYDGRVIGTYMHGPLLPKNPRLTDYLIKTALGVSELEILDDTFEISAFSSIKRRMFS